MLRNAAKVVLVNNVLSHAEKALNLVHQEVDEVILFYSGGKDSLVLLDLCAKKFKRVVCVFMYFVIGLEHIEKYLRWVDRYENAELIQIPHCILSIIYREGIYCHPDPSIPIRKLADMRTYAVHQTGIEWCIMGMKQSDSLNRKLMLRGYEEHSICRASKTAYPLSLWKKNDVLSYIKHAKLPTPVDYGLKGKSSGMTFDEGVFVWLREHYPGDLEKIYQKFPLSKQILFEYDARNNELSIRNRNDSPPRNKKRAV